MEEARLATEPQLKPFPDYMAPIKGLVEQHARKLKREPLRLAIYYASQSDPNAVSLLEMLDGFGRNRPSEDSELMYVDYASTAAFPMFPGQSLRMTLTNPKELQQAWKEHWGGIQDLVQAVKLGQATVVHEDLTDELKAELPEELIQLVRKSS
jgi:hypothetical protein